jgi:pimeloyl-ACP methyl ester carboxylesterase
MNARWLLGFVLASSVVACDRAAPLPAAIRSEPAPSAVVLAPPAASDVVTREAREPATVERVDVPRDSPASFVRAPAHAGTPATARILFLPGLCSNAYAYLLAFPEAARAHGGIVAIDGDQPCGPPDSGFHTFTWSAPLQRARLDAALAAVAVTAPPDGFTLVGYSAGASIAQMLHERWPERFPRLVLIAPPEDPTPTRMKKAEAVVTMSCAMDVPYRMKAARDGLTALHVPSIYVEMPGCTHGNVTDGERLFGVAFDFLEGGQREPKNGGFVSASPMSSAAK